MAVSAFGLHVFGSATFLDSEGLPVFRSGSSTNGLDAFGIPAFGLPAVGGVTFQAAWANANVLIQPGMVAA